MYGGRRCVPLEKNVCLQRPLPLVDPCLKTIQDQRTFPKTLHFTKILDVVIIRPIMREKSCRRAPRRDEGLPCQHLTPPTLKYSNNFYR